MNIPRAGVQPSAPPACMVNEYTPRITSGLSQQPPPPPPPPPPPYSLRTPYPVPPPTHHHTTATVSSDNRVVYIVPQTATEKKDASLACLCTKCMCRLLLIILPIVGIVVFIIIRGNYDAKRHTYRVPTFH